MYKILIKFILANFICFNSFSFYSYNKTYWGFGANQSFDKVQDKDGEKEYQYFSPTIVLGTTINVWKLQFSPQIGYFNDVLTKSEDQYGGDFKVSSFYILYDFLFNMRFCNCQIRYGLGNFIRSVKGEGGQATTPNGSSGSATGYRPSEASRSYIGTFNLGLQNDRFFNTSFDWILEFFAFSPLNSEKRTFSLNFLLTKRF